MTRKKQNLRGIEGWLIIFNAWIILGIVFNIIFLVFYTVQFGMALAPTILLIAYLLLFPIFGYLEIKLKKEFIPFSIFFLFFGMSGTIIIDLLYNPAEKVYFTGLVPMIWMVYIALSRRVKNTFTK